MHFLLEAAPLFTLGSVPITYFELCLIFINIIFIWETYLHYRQHTLLRIKELPNELNECMTADDFSKSKAYNSEKSIFHFVSDFINQIQTNIVIIFFFLPFFWKLSVSLTSSFGGGDSEIIASIIFNVIGFLVATIWSIPFELYNQFVIEERHGFNKMTKKLFIRDTLISFALGLVLISILVPPIIIIIKVWLFIFMFQLAMITIYPIFIQPLFNKLTPLPDCDLKTKIEAIAGSEKIQFPLKKIFVMDGSKRSTKSNAYMYGFCGNKRLVLFDTLLPIEVIDQMKREEVEGLSEEEKASSDKTEESSEEETNELIKPIERLSSDEVVSILAHELGHWKYWHVAGFLTISQVSTLLTFFILGLFINDENLYLSFGFESKPTIIGLILFLYCVFQPVSYILGFFVNLLSCQFERQADGFACDLGFASLIRSALIKLGFKANRAFPLSDSLYSLFNNSHPPLLDRIRYFDKRRKDSEDLGNKKSS